VALNNTESMDIHDLAPRLHRIFDVRAERVVFVKAGRGGSFRSVAEVIDTAKQQIEVVALLTPSVEKRKCWHIRRPSPIEWVSTGRQPPRWP